MRADMCKRAVEMAFYSAERNSGDGSDFVQFHLLDEAEEEDSALTRRKGGDDLPDDPNLLGGDEAGLCKRVGMREEGSDLGCVDGLSGDAAPETKTVGAGVIANEIQGDTGEPGDDGAVAAKGRTGVPGAEE